MAFSHLRKIAAFLLAFVLLVSLATMAFSCSSGTTSTASKPATTTTTTSTTTTPPKPANPQIIMASTTSTRDTGLMDVLIPIFEKQTGYQVKPVYVGTGAAITMGQQGNADVCLVHSPTLEKPFMDSGVGINRRLVMHNYFLVVGPPSDPAGIKGMTTGVDAFKKIADAKATFYSRGDASGTDTTEKALWKQLGISVSDNSSSNPSWYKEGGTGTGMLDLLRIASEKNAYTFTDAATYILNLASKVFTLDIDVQGDPSLINIYHVIQVNPAKYPNVNAAGAQAFSDFMVSPSTQTIIANYGVDKVGKPVFTADAGKTEASLGSF